MKHLIAGLALTFITSNAMAYSIHGSSETGFILECNDGTTLNSQNPTNHNTASEFCEGHGGVAAGYPKKVVKVSRMKPLAPSNPFSSGASSSNNKATDYSTASSELRIKR